MSRIVIDTNKRSLSLNLKELLEYKDLFWILAYRDFKVRYAQTFLGFLWALLQPLASLLVFTLVFGETIRVDTGNISYPLFALSGMCAWSYFSYVLNQSGSSMIASQNMIQKIYFPRLVVPLSKAIVGFVDFAIVLVLVFILMLFYQVKISYTIIYLPVFILLTVITSLAVGIWISALTIRYRDIQTIVPFFVQLGFYASPIAYPTSIIKEKYEVLFYLNPMTGVIQGFRWCLLGVDPPNILCYVSFIIVILLFAGSLFYFKKVERVMADVI